MLIDEPSELRQTDRPNISYAFYPDLGLVVHVQSDTVQESVLAQVPRRLPWKEKKTAERKDQLAAGAPALTRPGARLQVFDVRAQFFRHGHFFPLGIMNRHDGPVPFRCDRHCHGHWRLRL
jgi:hypothetical protein